MSDLATLPGVGEKRLAALQNAGIASVRDLALRLPTAYRDYTVTTAVCMLESGMHTVFFAALKKPPSVLRHGRLSVTTCVFADDTGDIQAMFFNQPYLRQTLRVGQKYALYARMEVFRGRLCAQSPSFVAPDELGTIQPVYPPVAGVPAKTYRHLVRLALEQTALPEQLPEDLRARCGLCGRAQAYMQAHFPQNPQALFAARRYLNFESMLLYQMQLRFWRTQGQNGVVIDARARMAPFFQALPFAPTGAQRRVMDEILNDLAGNAAMARMVQGDVGSGKTAVAQAALYACAVCGYQGALMAPTEVLARQHYASCKALLEPLGVRVGLLVGSMTAKQHRLAHQAIADGAWQVIVGTHALITETVVYQRLGLAITDEQHRFGVRQRTDLGKKGAGVNVLVMSATPIPRSLTLTLYGDLAVSVIDELPPGRKPVHTHLVPEHKRQGLYGFIAGQVAQGRQGYVVCPLIEKNDVLALLSAQETLESLTRALPQLRIALVHGAMRPAAKDAVLQAFYEGQVDVLVSTTVIEVGVNVPNASFMVVEEAHRFGLAQLHQLRGRVGRGDYDSYCFLMADGGQKLRILTKTNDGFLIAQKDLELRGPGDIAGTRQSGASGENAGADLKLLELARQEAQQAAARMDEPAYARLWAQARLQESGGVN
jgi:ATP-dependent DNA helicase RecG